MLGAVSAIKTETQLPLDEIHMVQHWLVHAKQIGTLLKVMKK
jgi:hypothetical protein